MRTLALMFLFFIPLGMIGCERPEVAAPEPPPQTGGTATPIGVTQVANFPEPKSSPERTAFLALEAKKTEYETRRKTLEDEHVVIERDFRNQHPGIDAPSGMSESDAPPPPVSDEIRAARRELGQMRRKHGQIISDLNVELLKFLNTEFYPALLTYGEFCHKAFLADPSKANAGELFRISDMLYWNGNLDEAYLYCSDLVKKDADIPELYDLAAAAAYCTDHFAEAAEWNAKARRNGSYTRVSLVAVESDIEQSQKAWETEQKLREAEAAADDLPRVKLETEVGDIVFELFENEAPETVANYISLVESGFYDNTTFHSVVLTASIFHGAKRGEDPGYTIYCETEKPNRRFPFRGALTMSVPAKDQGSTIYKIVLRASPYTDGFATTFGRVIEGFDVLAKINKYNARGPMAGMEPTKVLKATVVRKRPHDYVPRKVESATASN